MHTSSGVFITDGHKLVVLSGGESAMPETSGNARDLFGYHNWWEGHSRDLVSRDQRCY